MRELVPRISLKEAQCPLNEMAGTKPGHDDLRG
jgi:hypothetical protein